MKAYPEIPGSAKSPLGKRCIAFYKYDGSNLRFEWSKKQGWHKFGSRSQLIDRTDPILGPAIPMFLAHPMATEIVERVKKDYRENQRIIAYCEYWGPQSFAGIHELGDDMNLTLIDMELYKKGIIPPREFLRLMGDRDYTAKVVYEGNLNQSFIADVRRGAYPVWEGVIAKGEGFMVKIKTDAYFQKLNEVYGTEYRRYWE